MGHGIASPGQGTGRPLFFSAEWGAIALYWSLLINTPVIVGKPVAPSKLVDLEGSLLEVRPQEPARIRSRRR